MEIIKSLCLICNIRINNVFITAHSTNAVFDIPRVLKLLYLGSLLLWNVMYNYIATNACESYLNIRWKLINCRLIVKLLKNK